VNKVTDKMVKLSDTIENVLRQLQIVQIQHTYVISSQKNLKNRTFRSYPFKKFPAEEVGFPWNSQNFCDRVSLYL
jgi:hypothetical protein